MTLRIKRGVKVETAVLIKKAKQGDREALVQLIMERKEDYYKLAYVYMNNPEDTLDALEDMIVILYENTHRLRKEEAFYSWSKTILVNCCKNLLRKKKKLVSLDTIREQAGESPFGFKDSQIVLEQHLSRLSEKQQEAIKLRYYLDLDYQSIAEILKIPLGTVKSRISIGLQNLEKALGGERFE